MKVLVACEFSGIVREVFIKQGHDAWSCDLIDTEIPGPHIKGDVLEVINDSWDLLIAVIIWVTNFPDRLLYQGGQA